MAAKKVQQDDQSKHSSALLLAEHGRISALYQHNAQMGDKYVTTYLTTMSLTIALLVGISKFGVNNQTNISIDLALLAALLIVGVIIFRRLVERRIRMIEYLRAINRIHHYFALLDKTLAEHLYWSPNDDHPPIHLKGSFLGGLRDIVIILNSLSMGIGVYLITQLISPPKDMFTAITISIISAFVVLITLELYGRLLMQRAHISMGKTSLYPRTIPPLTKKK